MRGNSWCHTGFVDTGHSEKHIDAERLTSVLDRKGNRYPEGIPLELKLFKHEKGSKVTKVHQTDIYYDTDNSMVYNLAAFRLLAQRP